MLTVTPGAQDVAAGTSAGFTISTSGVSGNAALSIAGTSLLSASGGTNMIGYSFKPATVGSTSSTLTLNVGASVSAANYHLTISATSGSTTQTAALTLGVIPAGASPAGFIPPTDASHPADASTTPPAAAPATPANPSGPLSADCAELKTCTLSVQTKGPFPDPDVYEMGWDSAAFATLGDGRNCILFLLGGTGSGGSDDNAVRCFNTSTNAFTYVLPDTETNDGPITGNGLDTRDNMMMLSIPGVGLLVHGGAYFADTKPYWDGFLSYRTGQWIFRNNIYDLFVAPAGFFTWDQNQGQGLGAWVADWSNMNPATAWSTQLNEGFIYGGDNNGGSPGNYITLVKPRSDGRFDLVSVPPPPGTLSCTFVRNNAVAVSDLVYVAGGRCTNAAGNANLDSDSFRSFNLVTYQWQSLGSLPQARYMPVVTYDSRSGYIIMYGGNGGTGLTIGGPGYSVGQNSVYIWNVATQGPWIDITAKANMPYISLPIGAYDPTTGWNCYHPGDMYDANGNAIPSGPNTAQVWCLQLVFTPQ